jgi:DNA repair exonuclease SbcCD ATPase subunit
MKITRLKLVNFIGIKHGMDRDEVEVVFKNGRIVMLNGGNGSGKSTLLSQLHPFKDSYDDRKTIIVEGTDGVKEIDIENNGDVYEIKHIYGKGAKSFIKKNGTEMNENGGVKTFNAFIESEFGLTPDYFKIGKIGSNTQNFIQFTTAERKQYISKFLPDIGDYLENFEIIRKKFLILSDNIKAVSNDLSKLDDEVALKTKIQGLETLIGTLDSQIEKTSGTIAVLESQIKEHQEKVDNINLAVLTLEKSEKEKKINEVIQNGQLFVMNYGKKDITTLDAIIQEKSKLVKELGEEIAVMVSKKQAGLAQVIAIENEIAKLNFNLSGMNISESLEELESKIKETKEKLEVLKKTNEEAFAITVKVNQKDIPIQLAKFETFKNFLIKSFSNLRNKVINPSKTNIEMFMEENFQILLDNQVTSMRNLIAGKQSNLTSTQVILKQKQADYEKFSKIYGEGVDKFEFVEACKGCPLAKDAIEYQKLPEEITVLEEKIEQMKKDLEEFELKAEYLEDTKNLFKTFKTQFEQVNPRTNQVYIEYIKLNGSLTNIVLGNINDLTKSTDEIVDLVNTTIYNIQQMNLKETDIQNLEYKLNLVKNNEKIKKHVTDNIAEKTRDLEKLKEEIIPEIENSIKTKNTILSDETKILKDHQGYLEGKKNINTLALEVQNLNKQENEYKENIASIKTKAANLLTENSSVVDLKKRRTDSNSDLLKAKTALSTVENLKKRKAELDLDYKNQKLIKDALDPNKGIPLYFIKSYLEKTKDITNELLELAFDGNFEINFFTDASDFFIQVRAGENVKNDIKEASQGELALTTISISLSLIEQSIGKYNILALDEIDGPLDTGNRQNFITILNRQIEKLGIEQVFVISHNDAFDSEEMDLILLKGHNTRQKGDEFMRNKTVIFSA